MKYLLMLFVVSWIWIMYELHSAPEVDDDENIID